MSTRMFGGLLKNGLYIVDLDWHLGGNDRALRHASRCVDVVVMMRGALDVMMMVHWLAWASLWLATLSTINRSGGVLLLDILVGLVMMMVVMMVTISLANFKLQGFYVLTDGVLRGGDGARCGCAYSVWPRGLQKVYPARLCFRHRRHLHP